LFAKNLYLTFPTFYQLANSKATIHEVGHMLGHMYDLDQDTGRLADTCVMIQNHYSTTDPICTVRQFCDKHACNVYANTFTTSKIFVKRSPDLNNDSKNSNLEISLKSNKNEYFQMEPIWVTVQIKNVGSDIDSVDLIGSIDLLPNFIISNAGGLQLSYHYFVVSHGAQHLIKLQPNEQTSFDMELSIGYGDISVSEKYHLLSYFSEDKYNAKIKFYNYLNHESAISNDIEFTVKAPTGVEFDNFNNLVNTVKKYDITSPDWKSYIKELKDFFTNNQSSIYSEEMYFNYIYQSVMQQKDRNIFNLKFIEECKAFFDKYPNSFYSENILKSLLPPYIRMLKISKQSFYDFLNELINKYPNTKVQTAASKLYNDKKFIKHFYK